MTKATFIGTRRKALRKRGFLARVRTRGGYKVINRRRRKVRKVLAFSKKLK